MTYELAFLGTRWLQVFTLWHLLTLSDLWPPSNSTGLFYSLQVIQRLLVLSIWVFLRHVYKLVFTHTSHTQIQTHMPPWSNVWINHEIVNIWLQCLHPFPSLHELLCACCLWLVCCSHLFWWRLCEEQTLEFKRVERFEDFMSEHGSITEKPVLLYWLQSLKIYCDNPTF